MTTITLNITPKMKEQASRIFRLAVLGLAARLHLNGEHLLPYAQIGLVAAGEALFRHIRPAVPAAVTVEEGVSA